MKGKPIGVTALASTFLAAGMAGLAAVWAAWPRSAGTSPLAAISASVWSVTNLATAALIWRRATGAPQAFLAAMALLLAPAYFLFPGSRAPVMLAATVVFALAYLGYRYLESVAVPVG